jgi:HEPN/Toprim N-terminal domain 1
MIHLAVGSLEVDWGKHNVFGDHFKLFQGEKDVANVPYYYMGEEFGPDEEDNKNCKPLIELKEGLSKPLSHVIDRLNLLGYTHETCKIEFARLARFNDFDDKSFVFSDLRDALAEIDVVSLSANYGEDDDYDFGEFFSSQIAPRLKSFPQVSVNQNDGIFRAMENLSVHTVLQLLYRNTNAASLSVDWAFNDIDHGGGWQRDTFVRDLDSSDRFLIVTEGTSDANILEHALKFLRPHIADFFHFVDMEKGYPFTGTGNVFKFVKGLISIGIQNKILVVFDNDTEGLYNYNRCLELSIPANMCILRLPDIPKLTAFPTVGPDGESVSDINGKAAAIECYLDLDKTARVRWTSYNEKTETYQGKLERKEHYAKKFLKQKERSNNYDYSLIEKVLDVLVSNAVTISEAEVIGSTGTGCELHQ